MTGDSENLAALVIYFLVVLGLVALILLISHFLGHRRQDAKDYHPALNEPFESGVVSVGDARLRFSAPFFLVAIFFVIFDLEVVFLFAWVIGFEESGMPGFIEALVFILILLAGLAYLWKLGALDWGQNPKRRLGRVAMLAAEKAASAPTRDENTPETL